jgi:hypothetical protein
MLLLLAAASMLCNMLDPRKPAFISKKGNPSDDMFVGFHG